MKKKNNINTKKPDKLEKLEKIEKKPAPKGNEISIPEKQPEVSSSSPKNLNSEKNQQDVGDNVIVAIRIRPLNEKELLRGDKVAVTAEKDGRSLVVNVPKGGVKSFTYDYIFGEKAAQETVFETSKIKDLINMSIEGYSTTIFAYGQTGSGKTHTIVGKEDDTIHNQDKGILPRSVEYLFSTTKGIMGQSKNNPNYDLEMVIRCNFVEIYNEQVNDLLNLSSVNLPVRWSNYDGFFVENLFIVECRQYEDMMEVVNEGVSNRKVSEHELNKDSSRSHTIFTIYIDVTTTDRYDGFKTTRHGKISFVDLAGSERLKESKSQGENIKETGHINKSLLTLGKVISTLSGPKKTQNHIPYRDSKLTQLLMDSLGGKSKTLMIATVTPSGFFVDETINTLFYSSRAKQIQNRPTIIIDKNELIIMQLKEEIKLLRNLLAEKGIKFDLPIQEGMQLLPPIGNLENNRRQLASEAGYSTVSSVNPSVFKQITKNNQNSPTNAKGRQLNPIQNDPQAQKMPINVLKPKKAVSQLGFPQKSIGESIFTPDLAEVAAEKEKMKNEISNLKHLIKKSLDSANCNTKDADAEISQQRLLQENMLLIKSVQQLKNVLAKKEQENSEKDTTSLEQKIEDLTKKNQQMKEKMEKLTSELKKNVYPDEKEWNQFESSNNLSNEQQNSTNDAETDLEKLKREISLLKEENKMLKGALFTGNIPNLVPTLVQSPNSLSTAAQKQQLEELHQSLEKFEQSFGNSERKLEEIDQQDSNLQPISLIIEDTEKQNEINELEMKFGGSETGNSSPRDENSQFEMNGGGVQQSQHSAPPPSPSNEEQEEEQKPDLMEEDKLFENEQDHLFVEQKEEPEELAVPQEEEEPAAAFAPNEEEELAVSAPEEQKQDEPAAPEEQKQDEAAPEEQEVEQKVGEEEEPAAASAPNEEEEPAASAPNEEEEEAEQKQDEPAAEEQLKEEEPAASAPNDEEEPAASAPNDEEEPAASAPEEQQAEQKQDEEPAPEVEEEQLKEDIL